MAFATNDDISTRLLRNLSEAEADGADLLIEGVQAEIEAEIGMAEGDFNTVPPILRFVTIEAVCREMASPVGAEQTSEGLGAYSYTVRYRETGGTFLTNLEKLLVRRVVFGKNSGSSRPESTADEIHDYLYS